MPYSRVNSKVLHDIYDALGISVTYLQQASEDLKLLEVDGAKENLRLVVYSERAQDISTGIKRLADDIRAAVQRKKV